MIRRALYILPGILVYVLSSVVSEGSAEDSHAAPKPTPGAYGVLEPFLRNSTLILKPDKEEPEWWAGAPSVVRDPTGVFWMACRMRTADAPRGLRGYEIRILRSEDGKSFEKVKSIRREEVPIPGFERPALLIDPRTGKFKLYGCGPWAEDPWCIVKWEDADSPADFVANTAKPVIRPPERAYERDIAPTEFKDPFILCTGGEFHCYVIGYIRRNERVFHFTSEDGERWEPVGSPSLPILDLSGWHNFHVRPSCVLPLGVGYLFVYEGSSTQWYDPVYNIVTGLAFTFDLHHLIDLTPDAPLLVSETPNRFFSTFRYSHWLDMGNEVWIYAEVAAPDQTHQIRLYRVPKDRLPRP
ncbi:MAG: hypothetical protein GHCLOJNM_00984 [bacterium]|nr:hypothetical protein [bacterium]